MDEEVYAGILGEGTPRVLNIELRKGVGKEAVAFRAGVRDGRPGEFLSVFLRLY